MVIGAQATYEIDVQDVEYLRHGETPLLARLFIPRGSGPASVPGAPSGGLASSTRSSTIAGSDVQV